MVGFIPLRSKNLLFLRQPPIHPPKKCPTNSNEIIFAALHAKPFFMPTDPRLIFFVRKAGINLKVLRLSGYQTTDATLAIIGRLGRLNGLTIEEAAITDAGLARLAGLPLDEINLSRCYSITDEGLRHLKGFANLRQLGIRGIPLSGSGLKYLGGSDKLVRLKLSEMGLKDAALEPLRGLKNLARLELRQTQITDAALEIIGGMKKLEYLDIAQTGVSDEGVKRLAQSLPKCKIVRK